MLIFYFGWFLMILLDKFGIYVIDFFDELDFYYCVMGFFLFKSRVYVYMDGNNVNYCVLFGYVGVGFFFGG